MTKHSGLLLVLFLSCGCALWEVGRVCRACHRPLHSETSYQVILEDGTISELCCPRCGLHYQAGRQDVAASRTTDYLTGELIAADEAFYVENSSVMLCCSMDKMTRDQSGGQYGLKWDRCLPSLVSFLNHEDADEFRHEHGGTVKTFAQLRDEPDFANSFIPRAHP